MDQRPCGTSHLSHLKYVLNVVNVESTQSIHSAKDESNVAESPIKLKLGEFRSN